MKVEMDSVHPRLFWVWSESEYDKRYIVDICAEPRGKDEKGRLVFNGKCGGPGGEFMCEDYFYRCQKALRNPANDGKLFRCKHIKAARLEALEYLIPVIKKTDPNDVDENAT